jgi:hypothetical protein
VRIALIGLAAASLLLAPACSGDGDGDDIAGLSETTEATDASGTEQDNDSGSVSGGETGYSEGFQAQFMGTCVSGTATEEQCECLWDYFAQNVPYDEYVATDEAMRAGEIGMDELPEWITDAQAACGVDS